MLGPVTYLIRNTRGRKKLEVAHVSRLRSFRNREELTCDSDIGTDTNSSSEETEPPETERNLTPLPPVSAPLAVTISTRKSDRVTRQPERLLHHLNAIEIGFESRRQCIPLHSRSMTLCITAILFFLLSLSVAATTATVVTACDCSRPLFIGVLDLSQYEECHVPEYVDL